MRVGGGWKGFRWQGQSRLWKCPLVLVVLVSAVSCISQWRGPPGPLRVCLALALYLRGPSSGCRPLYAACSLRQDRPLPAGMALSWVCLLFWGQGVFCVGSACAGKRSSRGDCFCPDCCRGLRGCCPAVHDCLWPRQHAYVGPGGKAICGLTPGCGTWLVWRAPSSPTPPAPRPRLRP